jgi:hypothetical protein
MIFWFCPIDNVSSSGDNAIEYQVKIFASVDFMIEEATRAREMTDGKSLFNNVSSGSETEPRV